MKIQFEKSDRKYIYIGIALILFGLLSAFQYYRNKDLKRLIREKEAKVQTLKKDNEGLLKSIEVLNVQKDSLAKKSDSIEVKEKYYKFKYYATDKKLKDILGNFDSLSNDGKWDAFTKSIDN